MLSFWGQFFLFCAACIVLCETGKSVTDANATAIFFVMLYQAIVVCLAAFMFVVACSGSVPW